MNICIFTHERTALASFPPSQVVPTFRSERPVSLRFPERIRTHSATETEGAARTLAAHHLALLSACIGVRALVCACLRASFACVDMHGCLRVCVRCVFVFGFVRKHVIYLTPSEHAG